MIGAVVLAAGQSKRMGRPKMVLPWGETTVIGRVVGVLHEAGVDEICVVTGGAHELVEAALAGLPVQMAFNPRFEEDSMALSLQVGLAHLSAPVQAALVALGDQPQIEAGAVQAVIAAYQAQGAALVAPSYRMRRGHPWLIERTLWPQVMALQPPRTLRDFFAAQAGRLVYVTVDTDAVLRDLDTPEDYERQRV